MVKRNAKPYLDIWRENQQMARQLQLRAGVGARSFSAADQGRLQMDWMSSDVALNQLLESELPVLRTRSRHAWRNSDLGRRYIRMVQLNVVGPTGFSVESEAYDTNNKGVRAHDTAGNAAVEAALARWYKVCDYTGRQNWVSFQKTVAAIVARDGEALIVKVRSRSVNEFGYALQHVAVDRIDHQYHARIGNSIVRMGVQTSEGGKFEGLWILKSNPSDPRKASTTQREFFKADQILHIFKVDDAEQLRGLPWAHAVMAGSKMLHAFEEAATIASRLGASTTGRYKPPVDQVGGAVNASQIADWQTTARELMQDIEPGTNETLPPGWDYEQTHPPYPNQVFEPFVKARKQGIASGLDVAHHNLAGDASGVTYSSARILELGERDAWMDLQQFMIEAFVAPVINDVLEVAFLRGLCVLPNGSALPFRQLQKFQEGMVINGRGWTWTDPTNEAKAALIEIGLGLNTRTNMAARKGRNFRDNVELLKTEQEVAANAGVSVDNGAAAEKGKQEKQKETVDDNQK